MTTDSSTAGAGHWSAVRFFKYFDELESIYSAWNETYSREAWERTRILVPLSIQPHVKKRLTPQQLIPLPWDKKKPSAEEAQEFNSAESLKSFESISELLNS